MDKLELLQIKTQIENEFKTFEHLKEYLSILDEDYDCKKIEFFGALVEFEIQEFLEKLLYKKDFTGQDFLVNISCEIQKQLQKIFCLYFNFEEKNIENFDFYEIFGDGFCLTNGYSFLSCIDENFKPLIDFYFLQFNEEFASMQKRLEKIMVIFWGETNKFRVACKKNYIDIIKELDNFQNYLLATNK